MKGPREAVHPAFILRVSTPHRRRSVVHSSVGCEAILLHFYCTHSETLENQW